MTQQNGGRRTTAPDRRERASKNTALALATAALFGGCSSAYAVEGGVYGAPLGGTDIRQAYLPPAPGLYGGLAGVAVGAPSYYNQYGNVSATSNPGFIYTQVAGTGFLYEYPWKPWGWSIASTFQFSYAFEHQALTINNSLYLQGHGRGLLDSFSDIFFASKYLGLFGATPGTSDRLKYGLTAAFALSAEVPIGTYNVSNFVNTGKNTYITIPNVALTYLTGPKMSIGDGTEISTRFFVDLNRRNAISGYIGGNLIDLDYAISERMGHFQAGVAGDYAQQLNGDHNGTYALVAPGGDIYAKIDLGPVVAYDDPVTGATFKVKALFPVYHQNNYNATSVVFSVTHKLF